MKNLEVSSIGSSHARQIWIEDPAKDLPKGQHKTKEQLLEAGKASTCTLKGPKNVGKRPCGIYDRLRKAKFMHVDFLILNLLMLRPTATRWG